MELNCLDLTAFGHNFSALNIFSFSIYGIAPLEVVQSQPDMGNEGFNETLILCKNNNANIGLYSL